MRDEGIGKKREEIRAYIYAEGISASELARRIQCQRASLSRFLDGKQHNIRGGAFKRFDDLRAIPAEGEGMSKTHDGYFERTARILDDLLGYIRNPDISAEDKHSRCQNVLGVCADIFDALSLQNIKKD